MTKTTKTDARSLPLPSFFESAMPPLASFQSTGRDLATRPKKTPDFTGAAWPAPSDPPRPTPQSILLTGAGHFDCSFAVRRYAESDLRTLASIVERQTYIAIRRK